jgi:phosphoribosylanthranilate isomerase
MRTRVKICCMASLEELRLAVRAGADVVGLVAQMPSGPGPISDALAAEIALAVPPGVSAFLLTAREAGADIVAHAAVVGVTAVQIVRHVDRPEHDVIRRLDARLKIVQVVHVEDDEAVELARWYGETADALLLDSGRPGAEVAELGGTGRAHDWAVSRRIVEAVRRPVFLAGGLNAGNVAEAIARVRPFGVDVCSGLRPTGALDPDRLQAFMAASAAASRAGGPEPAPDGAGAGRR